MSRRPNKMMFDKPTREDLRQVYNEAVANEAERFTFEGTELYTRYAGYLLDWLDHELGP